MNRREQERVVAEARAAFAERFPNIHVGEPHCFQNLADPFLNHGDWTIVGVFSDRRAIEIVQYLVCVNRATGERRIARGWPNAYRLGEA